MAVTSPFKMIDIEHFMAEVKKYPEIWNLSSDSYHDRVKKRSAWISICHEFYEGFGEKEDREKNDINNALVKKWRNIKDTYVKTLKKPKSGSGCNKGRQYLYAKQLSFLRQSCLTTETESSLNSEQPLSDENNEELEAATELGCDQNNELPSNSYNNTRKRKRDLESSLLDFINSPIPSSTTAIQTNPNQSFFDSLVPILNGFTEEEIIDFRMEVLSIIKRMQKTRQNIPQQVSNPPNFNFISPQHGTHMSHPCQSPRNFALTSISPGKLSTVEATTDIQTLPFLHHTQNSHPFIESYYPSSQPSTSLISTSTNKFIPLQTPYLLENNLHNLPTSQSHHHNTASHQTYPTPKLPNFQQLPKTSLRRSSSTKRKTAETESHGLSLPLQNISRDFDSSSQYSVSPPLTSSSSTNEAGADDECLNLFDIPR